MRYLITGTAGNAAARKRLPMQPGDVASIFADLGPVVALTAFRPEIPVEEGIHRCDDRYVRFM